ncbi:M16 family metallopeptidase [Rhodocaloribacter sp.]
MKRSLLSLRVLLVVAAVLACAHPAEAQTPDRSAPPPVGPAPRVTLPPIQTFTLSNGLDVWIVEKHQVPLVQTLLLVEAGQAYERPGQYGLADLTADMLDEGAGGRSALELSDALDYLGARFSVSASDFLTTVGLRVPLERFDAALGLMADVALRPDFPEAELERLRLERLTELLRRHDEPNEIAGAMLYQTLFGKDHPYARYPLGREDDLRRFTTDDLRAFYATHYGPDRAALIVAGDVTPDEVLPKLEAAFGAWTSDAAPSAPDVPEVSQVTGRTVYLVDKPGAAQSVIRIGRIGPGRNTGDYYAIQVMNTVLGGSFTSRLNQNLREDKGYTYGARSSFDMRRKQGAFVAGAAVQTAVTGPSLAEFMKELRGIMEPIPAEEVERAKNFLAMRFPAGFQAVRQVAGRLAELENFDLPLDSFDRYTGRILAVTGDAATEAARKYLDPDDLVIVVVGDRSVIEEQVRAQNLGPVKILSVTDVLGAPPDFSGESD